ncbi:MAG: rRNA maturation RNase YbeY [Leptospirales bacterium]
MPIEIKNRQKKYSVSIERLSICANTALAAFAARRERVEINLVNNRTIRSINREYRGKNAATDVLSFRYDTPPSPGVPFPDGEILISVEKAQQQSLEQGISLESELINLLIHGICHLQGYDHEVGEEEAEEMRKAERWIAKKLTRVLRVHPLLHYETPLLAEIRGKIPETEEKQ